MPGVEHQCDGTVVFILFERQALLSCGLPSCLCADLPLAVLLLVKQLREYIRVPCLDNETLHDMHEFVFFLVEYDFDAV